MGLPLLGAIGAKVAMPLIGKLLGGNALGGLIGGLGQAGGLGNIMGVLSKFMPMAQSILGQLGNMGLGGLPQPPGFGTIPSNPWPRPIGGGFPGLPGGGGGGGGIGGGPGGAGGALGAAQSKFDSAMKQLTSGKELDQQTMIKLQQQIQEANRMFEMINNIQKSIHDSLKSMIRNIQA